jgi:hypothetical protein
MVVSEVVTFFLYALSLAFLPEYFGKSVYSLTINEFSYTNLQISPSCYLSALRGKLP